MNIFVLDMDPELCAQYHCDKHVVKMVLESAQLLSTAHRILDGDENANSMALYKSTHINHPCSIWLRQSVHNYNWTYSLYFFLHCEYLFRYGKVHKAFNPLLAKPPNNISIKPPTTRPQCMPDEYKTSDIVQAYRNYYRHKSQVIKPFRFTLRKEPSWIR